MVGLTHSIVNHFSLGAGKGFDDHLHLSTHYSPYDIGLSMILIPFYAFSKLTGHEEALLSFVNPLLTSTTVVVAYAIGRRLRWPSPWSVLGALSFGVFTMALQGTTELFSEPAVSLCVALLVWAILRWGDGWWHAPLVIGLTAAVVIQLRSDSILTAWIGLLAIPLFVPWRTLLTGRVLACLEPPSSSSGDVFDRLKTSGRGFEIKLMANRRPQSGRDTPRSSNCLM
jgi:hypothetical protein